MPSELYRVQPGVIFHISGLGGSAFEVKHSASVREVLAISEPIELEVKRSCFERWESKCQVVEHLSFLSIATVRFEMLEGKRECGFVLWGNLDASK